jgi:hypothetical protein
MAHLAKILPNATVAEMLPELVKSVGESLQGVHAGDIEAEWIRLNPVVAHKKLVTKPAPTPTACSVCDTTPE